MESNTENMCEIDVSEGKKMPVSVIFFAFLTVKSDILSIKFHLK